MESSPLMAVKPGSARWDAPRPRHPKARPQRRSLHPTKIILSVLITATLLLAQSSDEQLLREAITDHQSGKIEAAIPLYEKYLAAHPDTLIALSNLGAAYAKAGRYADAVTQYKRALKLQAGNLPVEMNLAIAYYKIGEADQAAPILEKIHQAAPDELQPTMLLADCWLAQGKEKQVVELLDPIAKQRSEDLAIAYMLGTALVRDRQVERGQIIIDKILRNGDSAEARLLIGTTKLNASDFSGARDDLAKAVEINPNLPDLYSLYGVALLRTGDTKGASEAFHKELAANPNDFNANLQLGVLLKQDENYTEALRYLNRALQVRPGDMGVRYQLASIDFENGKVEGAREALEAMVKEAPNFVEAHVTLATVYYRLKRKADGDRERAIIQKLNAAAQEKQPGVSVK